MTLPSSGIISLKDIDTEFSGPEPYSLTDFYRGGAFVPDTPANAGVPTSGLLSITDFYGASAGGGEIDSYLMLLNEDIPYITKWDAPALDNYQEVLYPGSTIFYSAHGAKNAFKTALGGQVSPYWKLIDGTLTDITPAGIALPNRSFCVRITNDGNFVAAAHHQTSPYFTVIDLVSETTDTPAVASGVRPDNHNQMAWSPDGSVLVLGSASPNYLVAYDFPSLTSILSGPVSTQSTTGIVFSDDGSTLYVATNSSTLRVYQTSDWSLIDTITYDWSLSCIAYSEAHNAIAFGTFLGHAGLIDLTDFSVSHLDSTYAIGGNGTTSVSFSYDNNFVTASHNFDPFAVVYNMPGFTNTGFDPSLDAGLSFIDVSIFIPKS